MGTSFTTISSGIDVQSMGAGCGAAALNELLVAYDEHRQVLGQSAYSTRIAEDTDIQSSGWFGMMQNWIDSNCVNFLNPDAVIEGASDLTDAHFTLDTFREAVFGASNKSWRRSTTFTAGAFVMIETITDGAGVIADGDYIFQSWLWIDLQNAFRVLTRTHLAGTWSENSSGTIKGAEGGYDEEETTWGGIENKLATDWSSGTWHNPSGLWAHARVNAYHEEDDLPSSFILVQRSRAYPKCTGIPTVVPHESCFYCRGTQLYDETYFDWGDWGVEQYKYHLIQSMGESSNSEETGSLLGDSSANPYTATGDPGDGNSYCKGQGLSVPEWIFDWVFSYT